MRFFAGFFRACPVVGLVAGLAAAIASTALGAEGAATANSKLTLAQNYGAPPAGMKVFVRVNQFVDGWEDVAAKFSAIVPTGA